MGKRISMLKKFFLFSPEPPKKPFVLEEPQKAAQNQQNDQTEKMQQSMENQDKKQKDKAAEKEDENQNAANLTGEAGQSNQKKDFRKKERENRKDGKRGMLNPTPISRQGAVKNGKPDAVKENGRIDPSIHICLEMIKKRYSADINGDFKIREFKICVMDRSYPAFVCFFDGMIDRTLVNTTILQPLMTLSAMPLITKETSVREVIYNHLIPHNQINICKTCQEVVDEVNFGGIGLFVDGLDVAYCGDVKGWEHRNIEKPTSELNIRGPRESFNESNRINTALLRKTLKDENMIVEDILIGVRSKTPCSMVYIKNIANSSLVGEVRKRLKSIEIDYVHDSGELEQLLEDSTLLPTPQMILTERPDKVAACMVEGRVGIIVHGSPFAIIAPITLFNLIQPQEDFYIRYPYATILRFIRIIGILFTLLLPSIYLAVTNYHQEMLPTDLLLAIASSREKVPFPTILSILIMEIAFELIREAGIRIPGPIGPTLGIVGALILGQAAVAANLVSPILIIIVAVTGIGSFSIPDFSLGYSLRTLRFMYLLLACMAGLLGVSLGIFIHLMLMVNAKSFGVPFMAPLAPRTKGKDANTFFKVPLWKIEDRPDYINPKDIKRQPPVSRGWVKEEKGVKTNDVQN